MSDHQLIAVLTTAGSRWVSVGKDVLRSAFPGAFAALRFGATRVLEIVPAADGTLHFSIERPGRPKQAAGGWEQVDALAPQAPSVLRATARRLPVCVKVAEDDCLSRQIPLPADFEGKLSDLVRWNLEAWTAFRPEDVFVQASLTQSRASEHALLLSLVPKERMLPLFARLKDLRLSPDLLQLPAQATPLDLPGGRGRRFRFLQQATLALVLSAAVLAYILVALTGRRVEADHASTLRQVARLAEAANAAVEAKRIFDAEAAEVSSYNEALQNRTSATLRLAALKNSLSSFATVNQVAWTASELTLSLTGPRDLEAAEIWTGTGGAAVVSDLGPQGQDQRRWQIRIVGDGANP